MAKILVMSVLPSFAAPIMRLFCDPDEKISISCRNLDIQTNGREQMIDLYGLNVNEAIFVLKRELAVLRNAARSVDRHLLVYVFVGVGHHTRGPTTPARIAAAVQRCLLEEGLDFSEPQRGLLRVMVY